MEGGGKLIDWAMTRGLWKQLVRYKAGDTRIMRRSRVPQRLTMFRDLVAERKERREGT